MPTAVITLAFDPVAGVLGVEVRLETIFLAAAILVSLLVAAWLAGRSATAVRTPPPDAPPPSGVSALRRDDLLFIAVSVIAGAVVGGRVGYALIHLDYYAANPGAILDPGSGSLELGLGVVAGALAGVIVAALVDGQVGRWLDTAAVPLLTLLSLGKVASALGGGGQGSPTDVPWATAYAGPGPWRTLAPGVPSHPSQLYEAGMAFVVLVVVLALAARRRGSRPEGRLFLVAIGLWALGRALVAATWRDAPVLGPLGAGQLVALGIAGGAAVLSWAVPRASLRRAGGRRNPTAEPSWPDPASRPHF